MACKGVSRDSLESNFLSRIYKEDYKITLGVDLPVKSIKRKIKLQFWIFSYESLNRVLNWEEFISKNLKESKAIVAVYNISDETSVHWFTEKLQQIKNNLDHMPPILLIGNKDDSEKVSQISVKEVAKLSENYEISSSIEVSLNTGDNIDNAFMKLTEMMLRSTKPDYRIDAKSIEVKKIPPLRIGKTLAFIIFIIIILSSIIGSIIMYYIL
ncbi:MAG: hypothetical protein ACFFFB_08370 [Candidatus Heimdallarchaeota archaeon]